MTFMFQEGAFGRNHLWILAGATFLHSFARLCAGPVYLGRTPGAGICAVTLILMELSVIL